jgi:D-alanyl-D-alanine carboxypeptidase/D-alanyl-D-alanine-endopeptidase (penicillin-binding protein 4)
MKKITLFTQSLLIASVLLGGCMFTQHNHYYGPADIDPQEFVDEQNAQVEARAEELANTPPQQRMAKMAAGQSAVIEAPESTEAETSGKYDELIEAIHAKFESEQWAHAHWGAHVESRKDGKVWYSRNAKRLFMPASNNKIITTAGAFLVLGPEFKFTTTVHSRGEIVDGVLKGDLVVVGNGDPTLYERFFDDSRSVFYDWADGLKGMGISKIEGNVVADDNQWADANISSAWPHSNLAHWYGAPYGPLNLNENYIDLKVTGPETADGEALVVGNLPSSYYTIDNRVKVVEEGRNSTWVNREFCGNTLVIGGQVKPGAGPLERSPSIKNPTLFYATVLTETLEEKGIEVGGMPMDCDDIDGWDSDAESTLLITHESPALIEILKGLMKRSQNMYSEVMVSTIAWQETGKGSFREGARLIKEELKAFDIEPGSFAFADGSGLSRYNYVSPSHFIRILNGMAESEFSELWYDTFPIGGVDGTIRRRMKDTPAEGNVRAKTGLISNTRALSGYVTTAEGEELVFSFLVNGHVLSSSAADRLIDEVLVMLASYGETAEAK